jgi:hypothetical protein
MKAPCDCRQQKAPLEHHFQHPVEGKKRMHGLLVSADSEFNYPFVAALEIYAGCSISGSLLANSSLIFQILTQVGSSEQMGPYPNICRL